eukprot:scaffold39831_cov58-Phaeocystis_antarctica.AAC.6
MENVRVSKGSMSTENIGDPEPLKLDLGTSTVSVTFGGPSDPLNQNLGAWLTGVMAKSTVAGADMREGCPGQSDAA